VPSIKATLFQVSADVLERLIESGKLTRAELETRLQPEDMQYLGKKLAASSWVPMTTLARVAQLGIELEWGDLSEASLRAEGERHARLTHGLGLYKQFDATAERWGPDFGKIFVTFASVAYNYMRWSFERGDDEGSARILVERARDFPELTRVTTEGYIGYMWSAALKSSDVVVTSERPSPDRVVYTIRAKR
jgi:hypothetical protein